MRTLRLRRTCLIAPPALTYLGDILRELFILQTNMSSWILTDYFRNFTKLATLSFTNSNLSEMVDVRPLANTLEYLELSYNQISSLDLIYEVVFGNLVSLYVSYNFLTELCIIVCCIYDCLHFKQS